jgi:hypothetical protein
MRPKTRHYYMAIFWLVLALPIGLGLAGYEEPNLENRKRAPFPDFAPERLIDDRFYGALSAWLEDHIPLRIVAVMVKSALVRGGLSLNSFKKVVQGRDDWLFLRKSLEMNCGDEAARDKVVADVSRFAGLMEERRKPLFLTIPPAKTTMYPEYLPEKWEGRFAVTRERNRLVETRLTGIHGLRAVPLEDALRARKQVSAGPLYYPTDSHWNCHGAEVMAQRLIDAIAPDLFHPAPVLDGSKAPLDLDRMIGHWIRRPRMICGDKLRAPAPQALDPEAGLKGRRFYRPDRNSMVIPGRTLVIYDSFMDALLPAVLPGYFEEVYFVHANDTGDAAGLAEEIRRSDRVVIEVTERSFCAWSGAVLGKQALVDALRRGH